VNRRTVNTKVKQYKADCKDTCAVLSIVILDISTPMVFNLQILKRIVC
jgi:hypothetical protein